MKLNIQLFASTNKTTNYELPQFIGTDKPTWLGDFNQAMSDIDAGMHENASDIASMESDVASATAAASQATQAVSTLTTTVNTLSGRVTNVETTANNAQSTANSALNVANTKVNTSDLFDLIYPVGSIYLSVNSTSPSTLFGGTWTQIKDTFLLGAGDSYTLGDTGGEATHTLTSNELPTITGSFSTSDNVLVNSLPSPTVYDVTGAFTKDSRVQTQVDATGVHVATNQGVYNKINMSFGNDQAHNNMPPYLVVSVWKRVS